MAKSSINFAKATSGGLNHNDRTEKTKPEYLLPLEHRGENEFDFSAKESAQQLQKLFLDAKENYKNNFGQSLQARSYTWEAVINLNREHNLKDVQKLVLALEKETGFKSVQIAIHRDEGHMNERGIPIYNLHAHVTFFTLDQKTGQQLYRKSITPKQKKSQPNLKPMNRNRLSEIQTIVAKELGMQRGEIGSKAQRLNHKEFRKKAKSEVKFLAKQKDLKAEIGKLRAELQELGAVREDYAKLEQVNKELRERIKQKDLTEQELKGKINLWRDDAINWTEGKKYKDLYEESTQKNEELEKELERVKNAQKESNGYESMQNDDKNDLKAVFDAINKQNKSVGMYEAGNLEEKAKKTERFNSAWIFKTAYENKGEIKKSGLLNKSITVTFKHEDLEKLYDDLKNHDEERTEQFKKAMELFRKVEKSLKVIFEFVKNKISPKKFNEQKRTDLMEKLKKEREESKIERKGFRR